MAWHESCFILGQENPPGIRYAGYATFARFKVLQAVLSVERAATRRRRRVLAANRCRPTMTRT